MLNERGRLIFATALIAAGLACGGKQDSVSDESAAVPKPSAVILDTVIDGDILGEPLSAPYGVAVDFRGSIYITDAGNHRVISLSHQLAPRDDIGGYGSAPGLLNRPGFISVDNGLNVLVADRGNTRVCRFNSRLQFVNELTLLTFDDPVLFGQPSGVALTDYGEIWVADRDKDRVALFDNTDRFDRFIAEFGYSGGQVSSPEKIAPDGRGGFLLCDAGNSRVSRYDRFGNFAGAFGEKVFRYPVAATVDRALRVWVVDRDLPALLCFDPAGRLIFELQSRILGADHSFADITDIAAMSDGRLILCDSPHNRLLIGRVLNDGE